MSALIPSVCSVALPLPSPQPYRYQVPSSLGDRVMPGARVVVPVRGREMVGVVVRAEDGSTEGLKPVYVAPDPEPLLQPSLIALAEWLARYYAAPLGLALRAMLPAALWGGSRLVVELRTPAAASGSSQDVVAALERAGGRPPPCWPRSSSAPCGTCSSGSRAPAR